MKKGLLFLSVLTCMLSFGQSSKVQNAYSFMTSYLQSKNSEDLVSAKENIDAAIVNDATKLKGKTWFYRGKIYQYMFSDELLKDAEPNAGLTALESYIEALAVNDSKFRSKSDLLNMVIALGSDLFNSAADKYNEKQYETAYNQFMAVLDAQELLEENGKSLTFDADLAIEYGAQAADVAGLDEEALSLYKTLTDLKEDAIYYVYMAQIHNNAGREEEAKQVVEAGLEKFPNEFNLYVELINYYIKRDDLASAMSQIDKAIELEPENDMLYFIKGNAYEQADDLDNALLAYEEAVSVNPENIKALYNAGAMYFKKGNEVQKSISDLNFSTQKAEVQKRINQRNELYKTAKPYFERVLAIDENDAEAQDALKKINGLID